MDEAISRILKSTFGDTSVDFSHLRYCVLEGKIARGKVKENSIVLISRVLHQNNLDFQVVPHCVIC